LLSPWTHLSNFYSVIKSSVIIYINRFCGFENQQVVYILVYYVDVRCLWLRFYCLNKKFNVQPHRIYFFLISEDLFDYEDCKPNGSKCDLVQIFQIRQNPITTPSVSTLLPSTIYPNQTIPSHNPLVMSWGDDDVKMFFSVSSNNRPNLNKTGFYSINHYRHKNCNLIFNEQ